MATKTQNKRGRGSKPVMDYANLTPVEEAEPLKVQRAKQTNPFLTHVEASVENDKAFSFDNLVNETAAKQVVSLLSRAAEILDYGMSTRVLPGTRKGTFKVTWQAKAERTRRPRKDENESAESNGTGE